MNLEKKKEKRFVSINLANVRIRGVSIIADNQNILERQRDLEQFLRELDEIRKQPGHRLSPLAGYLEKIELAKINKILDVLGYPT